MSSNPKQNGIAERHDHTLVDMTRCMLSEAYMDRTYWCEEMLNVVEIRDILPSASIPNLRLFEMVFMRKPCINKMRVFGSLCYLHIPKAKRT